jgi:hypothetical protein
MNTLQTYCPGLPYKIQNHTQRFLRNCGLQHKISDVPSWADCFFQSIISAAAEQLSKQSKRHQAAADYSSPARLTVTARIELVRNKNHYLPQYVEVLRKIFVDTYRANYQQIHNFLSSRNFSQK